MANKSNKKVAKDVKKNNKDKRHFMKDFKAELKKVVWPTPKQLFNNTVAVITIVFIVTVIVLVLDLGFKTLNDKSINRLRTTINNTTTEQVNEVTTEDTGNEIIEENTNENSVDENTSAETDVEVENTTTTETPEATETTENITE